MKYGPQEKYQKENITRVVLKLNKKTDADILEWLEGLDNKQGTIKEIIRSHIQNEKKFNDLLSDKLTHAVKELEDETCNRHMNDLEYGRYTTLGEILDLIDEIRE